MSDRTDREYLSDILEAIRRVGLYIDGMDGDQFMEDLKTQDAVIRALEIAGEATKQLSATLREQHPEIPWKSMAGLRDRLIHQYFGVNLDIVWQIATEELPPLGIHLQKMLRGSERG
jgi:uncharacterized protein with HEPN domain